MSDGGPAFPLSVPWSLDPPRQIESGMSLRDYFAGQALVGIIASAHGGDVVVEKVAKVAYHFADAMIAQRAAKPEGKP